MALSIFHLYSQMDGHENGIPTHSILWGIILEHRKILGFLTNTAPCHIICTLFSKRAYKKSDGQHKNGIPTHSILGGIIIEHRKRHGFLSNTLFTVCFELGRIHIISV